MAQLSNQFSTENPVSAAASIASAWDLGFITDNVRVSNDKATPVYVSFNTTAASTAGYRTCATESVEFSKVHTQFVALGSTTTTTGTVARVFALGA